MKRFFAAFSFVFIILPPWAMAQDCHLQMVTQTPLQKARLFNHTSTPVTIEGRTFRFIVDTGSPRSMVTVQTADALKLTRTPLPGTNSVKMFGGDEAKETAQIRQPVIGGVRMPDGVFSVMRTLRFNFGGEQFDGLIGADILSRYDADFDFANGSLTLYEPHPCDGREIRTAMRDKPYEKLPFTGEMGRIIVPLKLDGKEMIAILDTGASDSSLGSKIAMAKLALSPQSPGMQREGPDNDPDPVYAYTFKKMTLGSVTLNNTRFRFIPFSKARWFFAGLLGMPELRRLHIYIAYREHMLYFRPSDAQSAQ